MFIKKCGKVVQTAFHSRTIKSMYNKQLRWIWSTTDANVEVANARPQLGIDSQWLCLWPVNDNILCQSTEPGDQTLHCGWSIGCNISRFVKMKREWVVSTCKQPRPNASAHCNHAQCTGHYSFTSHHLTKYGSVEEWLVLQQVMNITQCRCFIFINV